MEFMVRHGDYRPDGKGGFCRVEGREELLQRVLWKLSARRGAFPFLPELGSQLHLLRREKPSMWNTLARQYVAQALADEEELSVTAVEVARNGDKLAVNVAMKWQGEDLSVKLEVDG